MWKEGKEEFVRLPCEMMSETPDFERDLDSLGAEAFGVGERMDLRGREWVHGREDVAGGEEGRTWSTEGDGRPGELPGEQAAAGVDGHDDGDDEEEVGAFADRHLSVDDYEDEDGMVTGPGGSNLGGGFRIESEETLLSFLT